MLSVPKQLRASPRHGAARVQVAPKLVRPQRTRAFLASVKATSDKQCVIWELDGGVVDLHMDGHRVAFNAAFADYGYDCIDFTVPLYNDLLSAGDGTAEGLLTAYFKTVGWPEMLPTADQPLFLMKIVEKKESELAKLFKKDKVPLRDSVDRVINDALAAGTKVVFIAGTLSQTANDVTSTVMRQLGPEAESQIRVFHCNRTPGEIAAEDDDGAPGMTMSEMLQAETNKTKAAAANNFAQVLKDAQNSGDALAVDVDNNLLAAGNRRTVTPELLSAICATTDVAMSNCVLIGASSSVTSAAIQAGMTAVAIPRRMAAQGSYPGVKAKLEGYGVGLLNWPRLQSFIASSAASS